MNGVVLGILALAACAFMVVLGLALVKAAASSGRIIAQASPTAAQIERPEPSAKATKNPHGMHHHFDVRHPHKSTRPKVANPAESPDPPYDPFTGGPHVDKPQEH